MRSPTLIITSWSTLVEKFRDKLSQLGLLWTGKHTLALSPHSRARRHCAPRQVLHRTSVHAQRGTTVTVGPCAAPWSLCVDACGAAGWCHTMWRTRRPAAHAPAIGSPPLHVANHLAGHTITRSLTQAWGNFLSTHPAAIKPLPLSPYAKAAPLPSAITVTAGEVPRPLASVAVSHP
jgi:hypothetical protein